LAYPPNKKNSALIWIRGARRASSRNLSLFEWSATIRLGESLSPLPRMWALANYDL
jgi:hypothetical protein